jgi:hypothetical protein
MVCDENLIKQTACVVVDLLRRGEVTPLDCLDALEARAAAVDSAVNALPILCFDGSVANPDIGHTRTGKDLRSGGRAEENCNEVALSAHVIRWCMDNLSLAEHRHGLVACNRP